MPRFYYDMNYPNLHNIWFRIFVTLILASPAISLFVILALALYKMNRDSMTKYSLNKINLVVQLVANFLYPLCYLLLIVFYNKDTRGFFIVINCYSVVLFLNYAVLNFTLC